MIQEAPHTDVNAHTSNTSNDSDQTESFSGDQQSSVIASVPHRAADQICQDQTARKPHGARKHSRGTEVRQPTSVGVCLEPLEAPSLAGALARDVSAIVIPAVVLGLIVRWAIKRLDPNYAAEQRVRRHRRVTSRSDQIICFHSLGLHGTDSMMAHHIC